MGKMNELVSRLPDKLESKLRWSVRKLRVDRDSIEWKLFKRKPELRYVEYHVAEHCNLNCMCCDHFCNVASPKFADLEQFKKDLAQLKTLFRTIVQIRLLGGEPFLNEDLGRFVIAAREAFPKSDIRIVTNGILVPHAAEDLLKTIAEQHVGVDISLYPPTQKMLDKIVDKLNVYGISVQVSGLIDRFNVIHTRKKKYPMEPAFRGCMSSICHFLQDGKLGLCPTVILSKNRADEIPTEHNYPDEAFDIYKPGLTGIEISKAFLKPALVCSSCAVAENLSIPWKANCRDLLFYEDLADENPKEKE